MEAVQSPKNAKSPTKEDRSGTLTKKKQITLAKNEKKTVNRETTEEIERKREFHRVIDKIINLPTPNEAGASLSRTR